MLRLFAKRVHLAPLPVARQLPCGQFLMRTGHVHRSFHADQNQDTVVSMETDQHPEQGTHIESLHDCATMLQEGITEFGNGVDKAIGGLSSRIDANAAETQRQIKLCIRDDKRDTAQIYSEPGSDMAKMIRELRSDISALRLTVEKNHRKNRVDIIGLRDEMWGKYGEVKGNISDKYWELSNDVYKRYWELSNDVHKKYWETRAEVKSNLLSFAYWFPPWHIIAACFVKTPLDERKVFTKKQVDGMPRTTPSCF
ncbi:hypothetical protein C7212DRAFT_362829 [Tuber magnatum]|uniref:Uncharacterized protein n=1 Tax=Tuber magnatum TaxID=42249 RepID=A0A317SU69_9PEZI|nr:hypothetical protein C7212DRAFT_362829 [Tuber magnatum]